MKGVKVKKRDLVKRLQAKGWYFLRHGGCHDVYTDGQHEEEIPMHREINERLAKKIIKKWGL
jgi:mRNA interferase HicA